MEPRRPSSQSCLRFKRSEIAGVLALWGMIAFHFDFSMSASQEGARCLSESNSLTPPASSDAATELIVEYGDSIYKTGEWDASPVVLEEFKLIFFTTAKVGCTTWKLLFRRMMGFADWRSEATGTGDLLPWNAELNGLKYLYHYDRKVASHMMTSPEWTRAIIVREPKERFVSAWLDKAVRNNDFVRKNCCLFSKTCSTPARESASNFLELIKICDNPHWRPQSRRMEPKYWPYVNFIGHMETVGEDAERLLKRIGAWEQFGASGWGGKGESAVFQSKAGGSGRAHATGASEKLKSILTPDLEAQLEDFYAKDYAHPMLNINMLRVHERASSSKQ